MVFDRDRLFEKYLLEVLLPEALIILYMKTQGTAAAALCPGIAVPLSAVVVSHQLC